MPAAKAIEPYVKACACCGLVLQVPPSRPGHVAHCPRCDRRLHTSRAAWRSNSRTAAIAMAALILYPPAVLLPMLEIRQFGHAHATSIIQGVVSLFSHGHLVHRLQSLEEISEKIDELVQLGASGIKVEENLPPEYRRKVMEEADRRGLPVVGHSRDARESISVGMRFIEHMYPISRSVATDLEKAAKGADPADQMDFDKVQELIQLMVRNDVYLNPTLLGRYGAMSPRVEEFYDEDQRLLETELFSKVPKEIVARYLNNGRPRNDMPPEERARREKGYANVQRFVREFSEQRGLLLAGTDMGNSRIPGISIHREMQLFVDAGVPPYKALLGATRYAAEMMRKADMIGTLEEGKQADILVLGSNPVEDIAATQDLRYVIRKGQIVRFSPVPGE